MNHEIVIKFFEMLKADKALAEELENAVIVQVLQFAANQGLPFTAEELAEFEAKDRKIANEELDQVYAAGTGTDGNPTHAWVRLIPNDHPYWR